MIMILLMDILSAASSYLADLACVFKPQETSCSEPTWLCYVRILSVVVAAVSGSLFLFWFWFLLPFVMFPSLRGFRISNRKFLSLKMCLRGFLRPSREPRSSGKLALLASSQGGWPAGALPQDPAPRPSQGVRAWALPPGVGPPWARLLRQTPLCAGAGQFLHLELLGMETCLLHAGALQPSPPWASCWDSRGSGLAQQPLCPSERTDPHCLKPAGLIQPGAARPGASKLWPGGQTGPPPVFT